MQIVWFKRDLRVQDNGALSQAAVSGDPVLPLYIIEPDLWQQPDLSQRHYQFLLESLKELNTDLKNLGQNLVIKVGEVVEIFAYLDQKYQIKSVWSHQETWNGWTYERDKKLAKWLKSKKISWQQLAQNGVIRGLKNRDGWASKWQQKMRQPLYQSLVALQVINEESVAIPLAKQLGIKKDQYDQLQKGGRSQGLKLLQSFFYQRGEGYSQEMSSPVTAFESCSRLSTYLAFGVISIREVFHFLQKRNNEVKSLERTQRGKWPLAIRSFAARLRWHCHFIQKLEDEPDLEFRNLHPAYRDLKRDFNEKYFLAWQQGRTGYPMIDACMRALISTGWLNFRMRAMLVSFASYHLWLDWRQSALYLARLFTDYEPGIHYSQIQMQSGTTGINSIRIYNPIKQASDHDPEGLFIRKWLPELEQMPSKYLPTPWQYPKQMHYPLPIIDEALARKEAITKIYAIRKTAHYRQYSEEILVKHGSRKVIKPKITKVKVTKAKVTKGEVTPSTKIKRAKNQDPNQGTLFI